MRYELVAHFLPLAKSCPAITDCRRRFWLQKSSDEMQTTDLQDGILDAAGFRQMDCRIDIIGARDFDVEYRKRKYLWGSASGSAVHSLQFPLPLSSLERLCGVVIWPSIICGNGSNLIDCRKYWLSRLYHTDTASLR